MASAHRRRKPSRRLRLLVAAVLTASACGGGNDSNEPEGPFNIVVIMADDLSRDGFERGFHRSLDVRSALVEDLIEQGALLPNFFFPTPLCCPSRVSFLTGQYPHNHRVHANSPRAAEDDNGGLLRFWLDARDRSSMGVWMQAAGYETGLVGKYLNGYPNRQSLGQRGVGEDYIPQGWDDWHAVFHSDRASFAPFDFGYYSFRANSNGVVQRYGDGAIYLTDWERDRALEFLDRAADEEGPFLLYLSPYAPHGPVEPRRDHRGTHAALLTKSPDVPSCNEADLSDKPSWIRDQPDLRRFEDCATSDAVLDMTLALDQLIGAIVDRLDELGRLDDTYVFFVSDNGLVSGHHRIAGKSAPYEESVRVPMVVRGPGIAPGIVLPHLAMNADLAPTFLDIAGASPTTGSPAIDGESLLGVLTGAIAPSDWRDALLLELLAPVASPNQPHVVAAYRAVRTERHVWIEYATGESELYDLVADPHQLDSIPEGNAPDLVEHLRSRLERLADCSGIDCAAASRR